MCIDELHMCHYQAVTSHHSLRWFFFQTDNIPVMSGYAPNNYASCIDLMIPKKQRL